MECLRPWLGPVICCLAIQGVWIGLLKVLDVRLQAPESGSAALING